MGSLEWDMTERLHFHFSLSCIGEGNGNPLQCSCLENPRDGEAWWAALCGVAQSRTRLKRLSSSSSSEYLQSVIYTWFCTLSYQLSVVQSLSRVQLCSPMDCSIPGFPVPELSLRVCSNLCPLSQWCHPTISSSIISFSSYLQSFPASGSFPVSWLFASGG